MSRNRFVSTDTHKIPLSDGDWIEVKKDLNTGDQKRLEQAGSGTPIRINDGTIHTPIDWSRYEIERAAIFLTNWHVHRVDTDGIPVPVPLLDKDGKVQVDAIEALDPFDFEEINKAIFKYVMDRAAEKNALRAAQTPKIDVLPEPEPPLQS